MQADNILRSRITPVCAVVSAGNGAVIGQSLNIALIDGSGLTLINPTELYTYRRFWDGE